VSIGRQTFRSARHNPATPFGLATVSTGKLDHSRSIPVF
jgi:hypothetical protein